MRGFIWVCFEWEEKLLEHAKESQEDQRSLDQKYFNEPFEPAFLASSIMH